MHLTCLSHRPHTLPWAQSGHSFETLTSLKIDAPLLYDGLFAFTCRSSFDISLANLTSLSITHLNESAYQLNEDRLEVFFDFLVGSTKLEELALESFALPSTPYPERDGFLPIHMRKLTIIRTGGPELTFLLARFNPNDLELDYCTFIETIPRCTRLRLHGIPLRRGGLADVMWHWDGLELEVTSSPAFDDDLVRAVEGKMSRERRPVWPNMMRVRVDDCPYEDGAFRRMLDFRTRLLSRQRGSSIRS